MCVAYILTNDSIEGFIPNLNDFNTSTYFPPNIHFSFKGSPIIPIVSSGDAHIRCGLTNILTSEEEELYCKYNTWNILCTEYTYF